MNHIQPASDLEQSDCSAQDQNLRQIWSTPELRVAAVASATLLIGTRCTDGIAPTGAINLNSLCL